MFSEVSVCFEFKEKAGVLRLYRFVQNAMPTATVDGVFSTMSQKIVDDGTLKTFRIDILIHEILCFKLGRIHT